MSHKTSVTIFAALLLVGLGQNGCAPRAAEIQGDIAPAVWEGIARGTGSFDHSRFDAILRRYAKAERHQFDYAGLKPHQSDLEAYLDQIAQADLKRLSRNELLALFINAYNAYIIQSILSSITPERLQGVASIRNIPNVFDEKKHIVGKFALSLNNIEHNILRPFFKDPRIHFAVNCASVGCPPLVGNAYTGEHIDQELDAAAQRTLQSPDYVRIKGDHLLVTKLLDWYGADFVTPGYRGAANSPAEYIAGYASDEVRQFVAARRVKVSLEFMSYDWSLNRSQ